MTSSHSSFWSPPAQRHPVHEALRQRAARSLRSASVAMTRLAGWLAAPAARAAATEPLLEFYAEAGAPEGAVYLDGRLVGWVQGVRRL